MHKVIPPPPPPPLPFFIRTDVVSNLSGCLKRVKHSRFLSWPYLDFISCQIKSTISEGSCLFHFHCFVLAGCWVAGCVDVMWRVLSVPVNPVRSHCVITYWHPPSISCTTTTTVDCPPRRLSPHHKARHDISCPFYLLFLQTCVFSHVYRAGVNAFWGRGLWGSVPAWVLWWWEKRGEHGLAEGCSR